MSWRDDLVDGEFAGVRVYFEGTEQTGGRRVANTEIPGGDEIHSKDLGKHPRRWNAEFFVIGDDYMIDRDEIIRQLEDELGPYTIIDPWYGEFSVELDTDRGLPRWRDSTREGGMCRFTVPLVLAKQLAFPVVHEPSEKLKAKAVAAKLSVKENFPKKFSLGKLKRLVVGGLSTVSTAMRVANGKVNSALGFASDLSNEIDTITAEAEKLSQAPQLLVNAHQLLWDSMLGSILQMLEPFELPGLNDGTGRGRGDLDALEILLTVNRDQQEDLDLGTDDLPGDLVAGADGKIALESLLAVEGFTKAMVMASSMEVLANLTPDTEDASASITTELAEMFDDLEAYDLGDETVEAMKDLKAAMVDYLVTEAKQSPEISTIYIPKATPALVVAHRVLGSALRDEEILRRNSIHEPLFVRGEIKVVAGG